LSHSFFLFWLEGGEIFPLFSFPLFSGSLFPPASRHRVVTYHPPPSFLFSYAVATLDRQAGLFLLPSLFFLRPWLFLTREVQRRNDGCSFFSFETAVPKVGDRSRSSTPDPSFFFFFSRRPMSPHVFPRFFLLIGELKYSGAH